MGIRRSQLVNMNQHYRRFSLDYFLDCQQRPERMIPKDLATSKAQPPSTGR